MKQPDYDGLKALLRGTRAESIIPLVPGDFRTHFRHGDLDGWLSALEALPAMTESSWSFDQGVRVGTGQQCSDAWRAQLEQALQALHPWRKGPYELFGLQLETEWRSDWKWDRVRPHISSLEYRNVLDVGCGNGYHCWRMAGEGARMVLGVDSHLLFTLQYLAIRHYLPEPPAWVLPLALEALPSNLQYFDTVFSMGVLYHRRDPIEHLYSLKDCLRRGGELVLETLVVEGEEGYSLVPEGRYARMPNVWFLPSVSTMVLWLNRAGYRKVRVVDDAFTSVEEQHTTPWMRFESLPQALDSANPGLTIEGYPAPRRAVFVAEKP